MRTEISDKSSLRVSVVALGAIHLAFGVAVLLGGVIRFPPPTYEPLLNLTQGAVWPYGVTYVVAGLLMVTRRIVFAVVGLSIGVVIHNLWAALFAVAMLESEISPVTAPIAYAGYGLIDALLVARILVNWRIIKKQSEQLSEEG